MLVGIVLSASASLGCNSHLRQDREWRLSRLTEEHWLPSQLTSARVFEASITSDLPEWQQHHWADVPDGLVDEQQLSLDLLIREVLNSNPSMSMAEATWQAALENRPIVVAFMDPQFRFLNGPTLFGNRDGEFLWRLQLQQRIPWYGKRDLMGAAADYNAEASRQDIEQTRQQLVQVTTHTFFEYALAEQVHRLAVEDQRLAQEEQRQKTIVQTGGHPWERSEDLAELDRLESDRAYDELDHIRLVAVRRINQLLHREPHAVLPPAILPDIPDKLPDEQVLIAEARSRRPELAAARAQEQRALADVELAYKDFYPDFELVGRFDTTGSEFWLPERLNIRPQIGVNLYMPVQQGRRWARVRQTEALLLKARYQTKMLEEKIETQIRELIADLEHTNRTVARLDQMVAAAERYSVSQEQKIVLSGGAEHLERLASRRKLVKYQMEQTRAHFRRRQQIITLCGMTGDLDFLVQGTPAAPVEESDLPPVPPAERIASEADSGHAQVDDPAVDQQ